MTYGPFRGSRDYWEARYSGGGTSGPGSYSHLAVFKAGVINEYVRRNSIQTVIEFGCGDGNQLSYSKYPCYVGLDVSESALSRCILKFKADGSKSFFLYDSERFVDNAAVFKAELALSLDVIYHLVEDEVYSKYLSHLFAAGTRSVGIYSSDFDGPVIYHYRNREFTKDVRQLFPEWELEQVVQNEFPYDPKMPEGTSQASFYFYRRRGANG